MNCAKRRFLNRAVALGVGAALLAITGDGMIGGAYAFNQSPAIPLFGTNLRGAGPGGIPVALPDVDPTRATAPVTGVTHYTIGISQFQDQITPTGIGLNPTTLWGYTPTRGLGGNITPTHLGGIIIGKGRNPNDPNDKNVPIQITFINKLNVAQHILPVDYTQFGMGASSDSSINKTAVHLHGGVVPWISDGGPFDFFGPTGVHGASFLNNQVLNPTNAQPGGSRIPGAAEYYYPLNQSARFMWYHDHAHGITRLNAYAGLATGLLVRDSFEANLVKTSGLPAYIENGGRELPLVFQDKIFVDKDIATKDPGWTSSLVQPAATTPGSLWYAHVYEPTDPTTGTGRWDLFTPGNLPITGASIIPEFFGDTMLVNGTTYPQTTVEPRRYRLRMLNACNARFLNLQLYVADSSPEGITLDINGVPTNAHFKNNATGDNSWLQIGAEGGFLAKPAKVPSDMAFAINDTAFLAGGASLNPSLVSKSLLVAPAERPDLIVDFKGSEGQDIILYNDAPAPFPAGDDRNDYFPGWNTVGPSIPAGTPPLPAGSFGIGNPVNAQTTPGNGPNTRVLMRFKVKATATVAADAPLGINNTTDLTGGIDPALLPWASIASPTFAIPSNIPRRFLTLNEYSDEYGRLVQIIGNAGAAYGSPYDATAPYLGYGPFPGAPATVGSTYEGVNEGTTEIWEVYNTTGDVHPMHIHLATAQLLNRQTFTAVNTFSSAPVPPDANELGWKETIPMYPGTVTRFIVNWDAQKASIVDKKLRPITTSGKTDSQLPIVNGLPPLSPRTGGYEYVWHCHILEHEEHDMMHALVVTPKPPLK